MYISKKKIGECANIGFSCACSFSELFLNKNNQGENFNIDKLKDISWRMTKSQNGISYIIPDYEVYWGIIKEAHDRVVDCVLTAVNYEK